MGCVIFGHFGRYDFQRFEFDFPIPHQPIRRSGVGVRRERRTSAYRYQGGVIHKSLKQLIYLIHNHDL